MKESGPRLGGGAFPAQGAQLLAEKDGCAVWQFQNESGEGTMTVYDVFPRRYAQLQRLSHSLL